MSNPDVLRDLLPAAEVSRLDNGLTLCLMPNRQAPIVTSALLYRVGSRDDPPTHGGIAHFLEHMMFKGSSRFGPGEIDRHTRALGGSNNAFTSQDATVYYFSFAADRWREALTIEADRMAGLTLAPVDVDSERQVIFEEIAMYEGEPWEALERAVLTAFFPHHPYGRSGLGSRESLAATGGDALRRFHERYYQPANAVLVVAGDVDDDAPQAVAEAFGSLGGSVAERPTLAPTVPPAGLLRVARRHGDVARLLLTLPAPACSEPDYAPLRLLIAVLGDGRASRLHRALVDEGQLCVAVYADLPETLERGTLSIAAEILPGVEPAQVEAVILAEVERLRRALPSEEELARARRIVLADWVFGHDRVHQQAMVACFAVAYHDLDFPRRTMAALYSADDATLAAVAERYLTPERHGVLGLSLPQALEEEVAGQQAVGEVPS